MLSAPTSRHIDLVAIVALVLSLAWCPSKTFAQDDTTAAKAHYAAGLQHFNLAEFEQALAEFKEAYRSKPDPVFLFNIGQCHRKLGHVTDAITFYRSYLREAPDAKNRNEVDRRIAELESQRDAESAAIATSTRTKAQASPISQAAQDNAIAQVSGAPIQTAGVDLRTRSEPSPQPSSPIYKRWWFWTAAGAVAAGAATVAVIMATRDPTKIPSTSLGSQRALP